MPVGKNSLSRAAESAAATKKKKTTKVERPATDVEAMPVEVLEGRQVSSNETLRPTTPFMPVIANPGVISAVGDPAAIPFVEEVPMEDDVAVPPIGVIDPIPEPERRYVAIGEDLPTHLL